MGMLNRCAQRTLIAGALALWLVFGLAPAASPAAAAPQRAQAAAPTVRMSLADLSYRDDITLRGSRAVTSFAFPLPVTGMLSGTLTLHLQASQVLDPASTVQVLLNDQPHVSTTLEDLRRSPTIVVPVEALSDAFLTIQIVGNLFVADDRCVPDLADSLWLVVDTSSSLTYTYDQPTSIDAFLGLAGGAIGVVGQWDTPQQQADSIALFSAVSHLYRDTPTTVALATEVGAADRAIVLGAAGAAADVALEGNRLVVAPGRAALNALLAEGARALSLGRTVSEVAAPAEAPMPDDGSRNVRTLDQLGLPILEQTGTGELPTFIRFTLADLGGWPEDLRFRLLSSFDVVPAASADHALIRVLLNGALLDTIDIRGATSLQRDIGLPAQLIQPENILEVAFVYAPETGNCLGTFYTFTGQIQAGSALSWSSYGPSRHLLPELVGTFTGQGSLYLLDTDPAAAYAAAELIGGLSALTAQPLLPTLSDAAGLAAPSGAGYRIVIGGDAATLAALELPIDLSQPITITNPQTQQVVLAGQPDQPLAVAQYLAADRPTLVLQRSPGAEGRLLGSLATHMIDPERFFKLQGDVVIGSDTQIVALDLNDRTGFVASTPADPSWQGQLLRLQWLIIGIAGITIIGLWVVIYRRVGRRPALPAAPSESADQRVE